MTGIPDSASSFGELCLTSLVQISSSILEFQSIDKWLVRANDSDAGEFLETICRETPPNLESVPGIGGLQQTMLSMQLQGIVHSTSILATTPLYHQFSCTAGVS